MMKAKVVFDNKIQHALGELTFNKTLNLYKLVTNTGNLYLPQNSINYVLELPSKSRKSSSRRKK